MAGPKSVRHVHDDVVLFIVTASVTACRETVEFP
jgi:hypothetical protein